MPRSKRAAQLGSKGAAGTVGRTDPAVDAFMADLVHPRKSELEAVRRLVLDAEPSIREGIKWKAPSFRTTEFFATTNLRGRDGAERVWLILHFGAKVKDDKSVVKIDDPDGLLEWLANDRAAVVFRDAKDIAGKGPALQRIIRRWIEWV